MTTRLDVLPNPTSMSWRDWADSVVGYNSVLRNQVSSDLHWEDFATYLSRVVPETPNPRMFEDWRAWAEALRRALSG